MQRDRPWDSAPPSVEKLRRPAEGEKRQASFNEVAVVICFLALIAIIVIGGGLMLLSWITATVPVSANISCQKFEGCAKAPSDASDAVWVDDDWIYGPKFTR